MCILVIAPAMWKLVCCFCSVVAAREFTGTAVFCRCRMAEREERQPPVASTQNAFQETWFWSRLAGAPVFLHGRYWELGLL